MRILKLFNRKDKKRNKFLIKEYEMGKVLQIGNGIDNKVYLKNLEVQNEPSPTTKE